MSKRIESGCSKNCFFPMIYLQLASSDLRVLCTPPIDVRTVRNERKSAVKILSFAFCIRNFMAIHSSHINMVGRSVPDSPNSDDKMEHKPNYGGSCKLHEQTHEPQSRVAGSGPIYLISSGVQILLVSCQQIRQSNILTGPT